MHPSALHARLRLLGFAEQDAAETEAAARAVLADQAARVALTATTARLRGRTGAFVDGGTVPSPFDDDTASGTVPLLAFVASSDATEHWHAERRVPDDVTRATLAELGRQVAWHREAHGRIGLEAPHRLLPHWQGSLYQLGRLQLDLQAVRPGRRSAALPEPLRDEKWLLSISVPDTGPLTGRAVDASLGAARGFFDRHIPGTSPRYARCTSWLLDPYLAAVLAPETHVVRFQRRFTLFGGPAPGDEDALWFACHHRSPDDLADAPRDTRLQRAVVERIERGDHWEVRQGWLELP